MMKEQKSFLSS